MHAEAPVQDRSDAVCLMCKILEIYQRFGTIFGVFFTRFDAERIKGFFELYGSLLNLAHCFLKASF